MNDEDKTQRPNGARPGAAVEPGTAETEEIRGPATEDVGPSQPPAGAADRRRLLRSNDDRVIAGVAGGLGRYFDIDPMIVRIAFAVSRPVRRARRPRVPGGRALRSRRRRHRRPAPSRRGRCVPRVLGIALLVDRRVRRLRVAHRAPRPSPPASATGCRSRRDGRDHRHRPGRALVPRRRQVADRPGAGADDRRRRRRGSRPRSRGRHRRPRVPTRAVSRRSRPTATSSASAASRSTCATSTGRRSGSSTSTSGSAPARRWSPSRRMSAWSPTPTPGPESSGSPASMPTARTSTSRRRRDRGRRPDSSSTPTSTSVRSVVLNDDDAVISDNHDSWDRGFSRSDPSHRRRTRGPAACEKRQSRSRLARRRASQPWLASGVVLCLDQLDVLSIHEWASGGWSNAFLWPLVLAIAGAALLWAGTRRPARTPEDPPYRTRLDRRAPVTSRTAATAAPPEPDTETRILDLYRGGFGVALVIGAALLFLTQINALGAARDAAFTAIVAIFALALILAPFIWRLGRNLADERSERIRSQERAEMAAHLHDSVLQTLTLMQKRADDPREVAALARRQERELRGWLAGEDGGRRLRRVRGRPPVGRRGGRGRVPGQDRGRHRRRLASRRGGVGGRRSRPGGAHQRGQVRGRGRPDLRLRGGRRRAGSRRSSAIAGPGSIRAAAPADRRGVSESIVGRMQRHGGTATIAAVPGAGTEVALRIDRGRR